MTVEQLRDAAESVGSQVPCRGASWRDWTSESPTQRQRAAEGCALCPSAIAQLCAETAATIKATAGVWAGFDLDEKDALRKLRAVLKNRRAA